jgi:hypothetical protein
VAGATGRSVGGRAGGVGRFGGFVVLVGVGGEVAHAAHFGHHGVHVVQRNDLLHGGEARRKQLGDAALDVGHDVFVAAVAGKVRFHLGQIAAEHLKTVFLDVKDKPLQVDADVLFHLVSGEGKRR